MAPAECIRFASFELDPDTGELWQDGDKLHLQEKPFQLLAALLEHPGEVVTREELRSRLWPDHTFVDFDHSINVAASKLREILGDSAEHPFLIETLPRRGYRFIGTVEDDEAHGASGPGSSPWLWGLPLLLLVVFGLLLLASGGWFRTAPAVAPDPRALAVLPLTDHSEDPDQGYLSDGITAAIIAELGKIQGLRVISWQSVAQFKNSEQSLPEIAYLLDVDSIVLGSVLRSGDRMRVSVQLVDCDPERQVWAESYERDFGDLLDIEQEVARTVASEIRVAVTPEERTRLSGATTILPEAYDAYLQGLHEWNRFSAPSFYRAIEHFEKAIDLEPRYAPAYSALADTWSMLSWYGYLPPHDGFPRADHAARRALDLDPGSAEAHNSMAAVLYCYRWQFEAADELHRRAIRLSPSFSMARNWYSWSLADQGRHEDALEQIRYAQKLDPLSVVINGVVGMRLYDARRYEESVRQLELTLEMNRHFYPALLFLGRSYQQLGLHEKALGALREAAQVSGGDPIYEAALTVGLASAERADEAELHLARLLERSDGEYLPAFHIATIYLSLDRIDETFAWLERAYEERSPWMTRIKIEPLLDPIRTDDRFDRLVDNVMLDRTRPEIGLGSARGPEPRD